MTKAKLETGNAKAALSFKHFPVPFQAVLFRNWGMVPLERLARMLGGTVDEVIDAGAALGLVPDDSQCAQWLARGYQTIIRQNWHLLTYEQLMIALDWDESKLAFILREDDFFWHKLGFQKPIVEAPRLRALTAEEQAETEELRRYHEQVLGRLDERRELPFDFLSGIVATGEPSNGAPGLRMLYSYSALYGDPLMDDDLDPFPDNHLDAYAAAGVNALWMQAVLYTLVPWLGDGPVARRYSEGWEIRLKNLRKLAQRMQARGIRLMLYFNEPRSMPDDFFQERPEWRGSTSPRYPSDPLFAICTEVPGVLDALRNAVERLFREVPELGGFFCITKSENLTSCWSLASLSAPPKCPRCSQHGPADIIVDVIRAMSEGALAAKPDAEIIAWNWAWQEPWDAEIVERFPKGVKLQCVSETKLPTNVGGCAGEIQDYSMSKPGPGPVSQRLWSVAKERGIPIVAKVQLNNTWELSSVPYIPVPGLVEEHLNNLREFGVKDFMMSWTLGGYPGGNLRLLLKSKEELAQEDFGDAAPMILQAYDLFDESFRHFPFSGTSTIYTAPQNFGPVDILFEEPTGYPATMVGFPYDGLDQWRGGTYPADVFEEEFRILSEGWGRGCALLRAAVDYIEEEHDAAYRELCGVAEASFCHFQSTYLQICFVRRREAGDKKAMLQIVREESMIARRLLNLLRGDSRLGFEASNHYYYTQNLLMEKLFNCRRLEAMLSKDIV